MDDVAAVEILREALIIGAKLAGPALALSLVLGVAVSLVQTVTQIQEATLTFVPKVVGIGLLLLLTGSWMLNEFGAYVEDLWTSIPALL